MRFRVETWAVRPETQRVRWNKIALVGVGLLGGSLGLALRQRKLTAAVIGFVRREASLQECERFGAVDRATLDLADAVAEADLIVLCTPIAQMRPLVERLLPSLRPGTIVTDVGSVKASVVRDVEGLVTGAGGHFVGSHPMAGAEKVGVAAARADLFVNAACVVTPTSRSVPSAVRQIEALWESVGARLLRLTPELHDELVSRSSHLPHVLAGQLVHCVLDPKHPKEQALLCANGFRDTTRIASGSPEMWRDIALSNRDNLLRALEDFAGTLQQFRELLQDKDIEGITRFFEEAKRRRDTWSRGTASPSPE